MAFKDSIERRNGKHEKPKVPHFECRYIPPDYRMGQVWPFVRAGLEELIKKVKPQGYYTMRPEDVYVILRANKASLYVALLDGRLAGFGIARLVNDEYNNAPPYLLSWLGWSDRKEATKLYFLELEKVAFGLKVGEIRHYSTRKGWLLEPPGPGWELLSSEGWLKQYVWTRDDGTKRLSWGVMGKDGKPVKLFDWKDFIACPEIAMRKVVQIG